MNIKQALKEKNKLAAKQTAFVQKLTQNNSVADGVVREYDPKTSFDNAVATMEELIALKTNIHRANLKVYDKIFRLSELKSLIRSLKGVDCSTGIASNYRYGADQSVIKTSIIGRTEMDAIIEKYEAEIETIQEELDTHNAKTKI